MQIGTLNTSPALFSLNPVPKIGTGKMSLEKIEEAAQDFEAMFVSEMIKPMFEGVKTNSLFGGGKTEEVFRGLMIDEYGKDIASRGGLGIAGLVKEQLIEAQEKADAKVARNLHGEIMENQITGNTVPGVQMAAEREKQEKR